MVVKDIVVTLSPDATADVITAAITSEKTRFLIDTPPGILLDRYRVECPSGSFISLVLTKYFARVGSFVTLVVIIHNLLGRTTVHVTTGGHKLWDRNPDDDWGASASFVGKVEKALQDFQYRTE